MAPFSSLIISRVKTDAKPALVKARGAPATWILWLRGLPQAQSRPGAHTKCPLFTATLSLPQSQPPG